MTKFKIGDRVRAIDGIPKGYEGVIRYCDYGEDYHVVEFEGWYSGFDCLNDGNAYDCGLSGYWMWGHELELISKPKKTLYNLEQGDFIVNDDEKLKVLGVCGEVYHLSDPFTFNRYSFSVTAEELEEYGYKPLVEEEEKKEEEIDPYLQALNDIKKWAKGRKVTKDSLREVINKLKKEKE
jgi:hypothetical protein